jgi:hypothetical protein
MSRVCRVFAVSGLALLLSSSVFAESIKFLGSGPGAAVSISVSSGGSSFSGTVMAGELNWQWLNGTPAGYATDIYTYCVDALNFLGNPQTVAISSTNALTGPASNAGAKVAWLFNTYAAAIHAGGAGAALQSAALQVAIWEALYDNSASLTGGNFRAAASGAIATQATSYLTALYSSNYLGSATTWLDARSGQDQITHGIPEPLALLLMSGACVLFVRRWNKRQTT